MKPGGKYLNQDKVFTPGRVGGFFNDNIASLHLSLTLDAENKCQINHVENNFMLKGARAFFEENKGKISLSHLHN